MGGPVPPPSAASACCTTVSSRWSFRSGGWTRSCHEFGKASHAGRESSGGHTRAHATTAPPPSLHRTGSVSGPMKNSRYRASAERPDVQYGGSGPAASRPRRKSRSNGVFAARFIVVGFGSIALLTRLSVASVGSGNGDVRPNRRSGWRGDVRASQLGLPRRRTGSGAASAPDSTAERSRPMCPRRVGVRALWPACDEGLDLCAVGRRDVVERRVERPFR
jgi:hypothetical protein